MENIGFGDKELYELYGYFYDVLQRIGKISLDTNLTLGALQLSRGEVQKAYKELNRKKKEWFKIYEKRGIANPQHELKDVSVVDFLLLISASYILKILSLDVDNMEKVKTVENRINQISIKFESDLNNSLRAARNISGIFIELMKSEKYDTAARTKIFDAFLKRDLLLRIPRI